MAKAATKGSRPRSDGAAKGKTPSPAAAQAGLITSARQLAAKLGVSNVAVSRDWMKHPDWRFGPGPWRAEQVSEIRAWASSTLTGQGVETDDGELSLLTRARIMKLKTSTKKELIQIEQEQAKLDEIKGRLVPAERHEAVLNMVMREVMAIPKGSPWAEDINRWFINRARELFDRLSAASGTADAE